MRCKACNNEIEDIAYDELLEYCNKCYAVCNEYFKDITEFRDLEDDSKTE